MTRTASARPLVLVSPGLALGGGGTAVVARLLLRGLSELCAARGRPLAVLHLGSDEDCPCKGAIEHFRGSQLRLAYRVAALQARRSVSGVVFSHLGPARVQALLPGPLRSRFAIYLHGIEVWRALGWQRRRALRTASNLLANSRYTAERIERTVALGRSIGTVAPVLEERPPEGSVDGDLLAAVGDGFLLMLGRMAARERYKGHDEVLEALATLRAEGTPAGLVIAGGGDDVTRLRAKSRALGITDSVIFTGFVSEATKEGLLERAAALVMPSRDEGFGLVYLEAMRAARPCVALADTAAAELITDGETGCLVPDGDPAALAQALRRMVAEPEWARRLGAGGRRRWQERHQYPAFQAALERHLAAFLDS